MSIGASTDGHAKPAHSRDANTSDRRSSAEQNGSLVGSKTLANRFAARLEKQADGETGGSDKDRSLTETRGDPAGVRSKPLTGKGAKDAKGEHEHHGQDETPGAVPAGSRFHDASAAKAGPGEVLPPDHALYDKIAAQIAELRPGEGSQMMQLTLPGGSLAAGAMIMRGADGGMAIRITGIDPRLSAMQVARMRKELDNALARRRVNLNSLTLDKSGEESGGNSGQRLSDQGGRESNISRVV